MFIFKHNDTYATQILLDGYKNLSAPYLIKNDEFICGAEKVSDSTYCLLHVKNNKVLRCKEINVKPVRLVVTDDMTVYFTAEKSLYRFDNSNNVIETVRDDLAESLYPCLFTDGKRIVYPKDNSPTYSWYVFDPETSQEKYIADADRCAGFTSDGDVVVTRPHIEATPYNSYRLKKVNTETLAQKSFVPFKRFNAPVLVDDKHIVDFRTDSIFNSLNPFLYLVSAENNVSVSLDRIRRVDSRQYCGIENIFVYS